MRVVGTRRGHAASRRQLHFSARSLRPGKVGPPLLISFNLANADSSAAGNRIRRNRILPILNLFGSAHHARTQGNFRRARNRAGNSALPENHHDRENFHSAVDRSDRHHGLGNFRWRNSLQREARVHLSAGLGAATVNTVYSYWGYYNICQLGGEIRDPERNIPRGIFLSIFGIAIFYLAMQTSLLGVLPWREAAKSDFVISAFMEHIYGARAAQGVTVMILWIAFASLFAALLGYTRVPYAAARDGNFFAAFGRVHPTKKFPHVSLLALGGAALDRKSVV